ncbi:CRISPR-associated helicase Cas3' [Myxococcota bacterium]|nr:CRISPR-associated helicase Cas3' [Myxococcota bacterium]
MSQQRSSIDSEQAVAHGPNASGRWHGLLEHLLGVSERAACFAEAIDASEAARLIGFWHDVGKLNPAWQNYLRERVAGKPSKKLEHAIVALQLFLDAFSDKRYLLLAYLMDCHHRGLQDVKADLGSRVRRAAEQTWIREIATEGRQAWEAYVPLEPPQLPTSLDMMRKDAEGSVALAWRLLHSCLVDADCLDTEAHDRPETSRLRSEQAHDRPEIARLRGEPTEGAVSWLFQRLQAAQQAFVLPSGATPQQGELYAHRQQIYRDALDAANQSPGFFSMTVPTGGGKTRSSMAFALAHAQKHRMRRVIVAIPYTSIIEQNASVYREIFGAAYVLEHHSSRREHNETSHDAEVIDAIERWQRLAAENWDAPIVVTTNVQLFESLFASRNSKLRKLHNIPRSVIILDEVQMLPTKLLAPTLDMLRYLVREFGCSVIFCTATQPAFSDQVLRPSKELTPLTGIREIVRDPADHFRALGRVEFSFPIDGEPRWSFEELAEEIAETPRCLAILNTIKDARKLLEEVSGMEGCFHLSSRLCPLHRSFVLQAVQFVLGRSQRDCRLVATQVVEAGVDLDFPVVFRVMGPLDSLIQAAGRCNREARLASGTTHIVELQEAHLPQGIYTTATDQTRLMLRSLRASDFHDPAIFQQYFRQVYHSVNTDPFDIRRLEREFAFASSSERYRMIPEDTRPVFVHPVDLQRVLQTQREQMVQESEPIAAFFEAFDRAVQAALEALQILQHAPQMPSASLMRVFQPFVVQLYQHSFLQAQQRQLIKPIAGDLCLWQGRYDALLGVVEEVDSTQLIFP